MTLAQVIRMVDDLKENAFSPEVKTAWINDIEGMVQTQVMMVLPTDIITYAWATDQDKELLVKAPHSQIYWMYLSAMVDFANGEYDLYTNTMQMFNAKWRDFQAWFLRMYHPADEHEDVYRNETPETIGVFWRGYYLTAYGIAVKHGYQGDEAQWLQYLKAREIQMNYDAAKKWIQWRLEGDDPWIDLLDIGVLQQGVIDETLKDAQASKLAAEKAAQQAGAFQQGADQAKIAAQNAATLAEKSHHLAGECANAARDSAQQAENAKAGIVEAETRARQSAEAAERSAQQAAQSAQQSVDANAAATQAAQRAVDANASATQAAAGAKLSADTASAAARTAQQSSTSAAQAASTATKAAQQAENAKTGIMEAETRARQSADTATQKAQDAAASAQKAQQAANAAADKLPLAGGTMVGAINMGGHVISNVKAPTAAGDVVTKGSLLDLVYPVGSIYMSVEDTSPAARWGGTWEKIEGRVLVGTGSPQPNTTSYFGALSGQSWSIYARERGGQDYNTLTVETIPPHSHPIQLKGSELIEKSTLEWTYNVNARVYSGQDLVRPTGGGKPHNNMMPYYGCYMWVRLA